MPWYKIQKPLGQFFTAPDFQIVPFTAGNCATSISTVMSRSSSGTDYYVSRTTNQYQPTGFYDYNRNIGYYNSNAYNIRYCSSVLASTVGIYNTNTINLNYLFLYSDTEIIDNNNIFKKIGTVTLNGNYIIKYNIGDIDETQYYHKLPIQFLSISTDCKLDNTVVSGFCIGSKASNAKYFYQHCHGEFESNDGGNISLPTTSNYEARIYFTNINSSSYILLKNSGNKVLSFNNAVVHEDFAKFILAIADAQDQITLTFGDNIVLANKPVTEISVVKKTLNLVDVTIDGVTSEVEIHPQDDKVFLGFSLQENATVATIPIGTTKITLNENTVFYEVWGTYKPEPNFFTANFYKNSAESHRVDKTEYLTSVFSAGISLREETNIIYPTILLQYDKVPDFNYCYIEYFGRYYYVTDVTSIRNNIWQISLSVDVLMSFKDTIKTQMGNVIRQENIGNSMMVDSNIPVLGQPSIIYENFGTPVFDGLTNYYITENNEISFVLITQGKLP